MPGHDPLWEHLATLRGAVAAELRGDRQGTATLTVTLAREADPVELRALALSCLCADLTALAGPRGLHPADFAETLADVAALAEPGTHPGTSGVPTPASPVSEMLRCASAALLGEPDSGVADLDVDHMAFAAMAVALLTASSAWRARDEGVEACTWANLACLAAQPPAV